MGQTPSDRLDTVADVAAAIEAAGNEITDLRVTVDDDCGHGTAHVSLPIIDEHGESSCEFDLVTATLDDGTLRIELDVATETPETTSDEPAPPAAVTAETPDEDGADRPVGDEQSTPADEDSSSERDATGSAAADSSVESAAGEDSAATLDSPDPGAPERATESAPSEAAADSDAPASDGPPAYRDPDRLAAVYDPEATFPEMTDALGVDVTPQTVRKYMIEHGIHEPASRASDTLAQANTDADEETGVEETESERDAETTERNAETTERNAETTEPEAGEAHQTSAEATPADEERSQRSSDGVEIVDGDESAASDASDRADTTTESVASDAGSAAGDATADDDTAAARTQPTTETNGDETDDATTDPPGESVADTTTTTSTATDGGTQPTRSAVESLELPDEVSVAELVSVLTDSRTVYEVRRGLGIDDSRTRAILRQYDLIDLVTGRITQGSEPPDRQEVLSRLSEASDRAS